MVMIFQQFTANDAFVFSFLKIAQCYALKSVGTTKQILTAEVTELLNLTQFISNLIADVWFPENILLLCCE